MEKKVAAWLQRVLFPAQYHIMLTVHNKASDVTQRREIVLWKVFKSWCGFNINCRVLHELSIIRTLFSPSHVSNASIVRSRRHSLFYGLPNSKNLANGHIAPHTAISEESLWGFELSERSGLFKNHRCWTIPCGGSAGFCLAHESSWVQTKRVLSQPGMLRVGWGEVRSWHCSP